MRELSTKGIICVDDDYNFTYHVAAIEYIEREDESFQYIITPNYSVIELLPSRIFQGIPGIDLDLKKENYVRENIVPVFISERTPGENREDLWELLEQCDMDYLNRLEWLVRTKTRYLGDGLYVCRPEDKNLKIESIEELGNRSAVICRNVLEVICAGGKIVTKDYSIDDSNRKRFYKMFLALYQTERKYLDSKRREGIKRAVEKGKYKGRSRINIDSLKLQQFFYEYENGKLTGEQAASALGISKSTFIRRYREYKKKGE